MSAPGLSVAIILDAASTFVVSDVYGESRQVTIEFGAYGPVSVTATRHDLDAMKALAAAAQQAVEKLSAVEAPALPPTDEVTL